MINPTKNDIGRRVNCVNHNSRVYVGGEWRLLPSKIVMEEFIIHSFNADWVFVQLYDPNNPGVSGARSPRPRTRVELEWY